MREREKESNFENIRRERDCLEREKKKRSKEWGEVKSD